MARFRIILATATWIIALVSHATAQDTEELAKESQNPIADLISVPFQNNTNFNVGRLGNDQNILKRTLGIQAVAAFPSQLQASAVAGW